MIPVPSHSHVTICTHVMIDVEWEREKESGVLIASCNSEILVSAGMVSRHIPVLRIIDFHSHSLPIPKPNSRSLPKNSHIS